MSIAEIAPGVLRSREATATHPPLHLRFLAEVRHMGNLPDPALYPAGKERVEVFLTRIRDRFPGPASTVERIRARAAPCDEMVLRHGPVGRARPIGPARQDASGDRIMPCATIHMLTAGRVLDRWKQDPESAPFPVHRSSLADSFLLGAMGPDMGFVPGVDRLVSELAHYISTGALARALLEEAETPRHTAFAWGWATHHLTDVEIHPLVGRACGEYLLGDDSVRLNSSQDCETHVAMEVGLDLVFLATDPSIPSPARTPLDGVEEIGFLARALEQTYGLPWDRNALHASHRKATVRTARWPAFLDLLARARRFRPGWEKGGVLGMLGDPLLAVARRFMPTGSAAAGFLRPVKPPDWLVERVRDVADAFPARFRPVVEDGMRGLEDRNLETGLPEKAPQDHPDSVRARWRLRELRERLEVGPLAGAAGSGLPERNPAYPSDSRA